ncbi:small GTP-binding protein [Longilinea arvoryzae]|uniref:Small GTP-binding protein n=1 Tax=Longilinea arvoryzae TaxID=360412 RepID=A0A0S7BAJ8_9CHLR|nr:dynamin family protein [Longilinea arvoryzae]GAP14668.1 small GTP-binding protein [Longilinea arvoryzae]
MKILAPEQDAILLRERGFLNDLRVKLVDFNATREDLDTLGQSIHQLDDLFLLVIVGEFNSGKSAFINALLGQKLLKEGVTPTTTQINILRFGDKSEQSRIEENHQVIFLPIELLSEISIVDTPGTNAVIREHEEITTHFVPRADLVLFITSADRPFTESERHFLQCIRDWGKKVVLVVNKIDLFQSEDELTQVATFVRENAFSLLGMTPDIFPVSARQALRAKTGEPQLWQTSRFEDLETYIQNALDQASQVRLKFSSPLGVAAHLVDKYSAANEVQRQLLEEDRSMLQNVETQQAIYKEDMQRNFAFRMADIENIFFEMEKRGDDFFEDVFRLARVLDLLSKDRIQHQFETQVVADVPQRVDRKINELIDWLVDSDLRQLKAINDYLAERQREYKNRIIGEGAGDRFTYDRNRLLDALGREANRVVETYDKRVESAKMALGAQNAVAVSAAVEVGALGLGALITTLATTMAADVTGIVAASLVAALGLFIIPAKRRQAKNELHGKLAKLRSELIQSLRAEFEKEIERSLLRMAEAIGPYTRFVRAETNRSDQVQHELKSANLEIASLRSIIENW